MDLKSLINERVTHTRFGNGKIVAITKNNVSIVFEKEGVQFFSFPNTFKNNILRFIDIDHDEVLKSLEEKEDLSTEELLEQQQKKREQEEAKKRILEQQKLERELRQIEEEKRRLEAQEKALQEQRLKEELLKQEKLEQERILQEEKLKQERILQEEKQKEERLKEQQRRLKEEEKKKQTEEDLEVVVHEEVIMENIEEPKAYNFNEFLKEFRQYTDNKKLLTYLVVKYVNVKAVYDELKALALKIILETLTRKEKKDERTFVTLFVAMIAYKHYDGNLWPYIEKELREIYEIKDHNEITKTIKRLTNDPDFGGADAPLIHAGIFVKFFNEYYSFMFDVYKLNFDHSIENAPVEQVLTDTFLGLRQMFSKDDSEEFHLRLTDRTYFIALPTKQALFVDPQEMAKVSKHFLRHIDLWYKQNEFDEEDIDFHTALKVWLELESSRLTKILTPSRPYVNKATYKMNLITKDVSLTFPVIVLKGLLNLDYRKLEVAAYHGDVKEILTIDSDFRVYQRIGFYTISFGDLLIREPLKSTRLVISYNKKVLYESKDQFNRDFYMFDFRGNELLDQTNYEGEIFIVHSKTETMANAKEFKFKNHIVSNVKVTKKRGYKLGKRQLRFRKDLELGVNGDIIPGITARINEKLYPVYRQIDNFVFESYLKAEDILVTINNQRTSLKNLVTDDNVGGGNFKFEIRLNQLNLVSGFYKLVITDVHGSELENVQFIYDQNLNFSKTLKEEPLIYDFRINSSFNIIKNKKYNYDFSKEYDVSFEFEVNNVFVEYLVGLNIPRFKYTIMDPWQLLGDMELLSNQLILTKDCKKVVIHWPNQEPFELEVLSQIDDYIAYDLATIKQMPVVYGEDVFFEVFFENGESEKYRFYVEPEVLGKPKERFTNTGELRLEFDIKCFQSNRWVLETTDYFGRNKEYPLESNIVTISDFVPFHNYKLKIKEKDNVKHGIELSEFYKTNYIFIDSEGLFGKVFKIKGACYFNEESRTVCQEVRPTAIKFLRKVTTVDQGLRLTSFSGEKVTYECELYELGTKNTLSSFGIKQKLYCEIQTTRCEKMIYLKLEDINGKNLTLNEKKSIIEKRPRTRGTQIVLLEIDALKDFIQ